MSDREPRASALRFVVPGVLVLLSLAYALVLHHGLGPRPDAAAGELGWWSPRGFLTQALMGSSWEPLLDDRIKGMAFFGAPSLLLLVGVWLTTRSALARAVAVTTTLAVAFFLFYALGAGNTQLVWNFFHWRWSGTMLAVAIVIGFALASPWLAASWLQLGWLARLAWFLPIVAIVLVVERNVTGTDAYLPFAISPWPAVQVFGFEAIGTTLASELGGLALAFAGLYTLRRGRRALGVLMLLGGVALPAGWLALGSDGLLPFRVTEARLIGAAILCAVALVLAALAAGFDPERLRRRARSTAVAAVLLGVPLFVGEGWARWDYTRTRDVQAQRIIDALHAYYEKESTYPDNLGQLVDAKVIDAIPRPQIGFPLPGRDDATFTYQGFGTSYLLEFSAPRWVQCAYNPPYLDDEDGGGDAPDVAQGAAEDADAHATPEDMTAGAWSCPSKPPELW